MRIRRDGIVARQPPCASRVHMRRRCSAFHQILMLPLYAVAFAIYWQIGGLSRVNSVWPYGLRDVSVFFSVLIVLTNLVAAVMAVLLFRFTFPMVERKRWLWFGVLLIVTNGQKM